MQRIKLKRTYKEIIYYYTLRLQININIVAYFNFNEYVFTNKKIITIFKVFINIYILFILFIIIIIAK